jgi:FYVE/RhoGEF/PH domain-containing protein 3
MSEDFNSSFRENVIKEVVQTEDDFVKDMNLMISLFLTPILERGILSANEVQRLFSNIKSIVKINEGK